MTRLPWIRLDTDLPFNPKIVGLLADGNHRAVLTYVLGICYAGRYGTDGKLAPNVLPLLHAGPKDATALVRADLWLTAKEGGWIVKNWAEYQPTEVANPWATDDVHLRSAQMNCRRWHKGPPCRRETCQGIWD